jgi:hypothetical protein
MSNNYIDNDKFFSEMKEWKESVIESRESGDNPPPITEYIGKCFWDIAQHLSNKSNFCNYPFKDDMIGDAVENCLMYAHNFDPEKSKNPFSYFTQITYYAFIRRIEKEKKQNYIKYKLIDHLDDEGSVRRWFSTNFGGPDLSETGDEDSLANYFSLSKNDIEKFTPKPKKKVK